MSNPELEPSAGELMDACRPNRDDVADPEMAALAELLDRDPQARDTFSRSQHLDRSIGEAFRDVTPPPGLAARLLAAVGVEDEVGQTGVIEQAVEDSHEGTETEEKVSPATGAVPKHSRGTSRRRWIALAGTLAASVVVAVYAAVVLNQDDGPVPHYTVADKAMAWLDEAQQSDWESVKQPPTDSYPVATSIQVDGSPPSVVQWQFIGTDYGKAAVYDLTPPGKSFVYLFTIRTGEQFSAPQLLPSQPARSTQGVCIGVAYHDGVLRVLVVEGDEHRYDQFIRERLPVI